MLPKRRRVGEVELELQQVTHPHRLVPEHSQPVSGVGFGVTGVRQRQLHDAGLQKGVDHRIAVERRGVLVLGCDAPHRLPAAVDAGDGMPAGESVDRRAHSVPGAQPQCAGGHRGVGAFQVVQRVLQGVVQLTEGQRLASGGQQQRGDQRGRVDRGAPLDPPGHLEGHLVHRQAFGVGVGSDRAVGRPEVLAHRHRFGETDIDLAVVALALGFDEVVEPADTLGGLFGSPRVRGVFVGLVQLVEGDRNALQQNVVAASVEVGVGHVGHQAELGRQHFPGPRPGSLDRPAQVEPFLHHVADVLAQHVFVQRVVADVAADEDDPGPAQQRTHRPERQVDPGEHVHRRQPVLLHRQRDDRTVDVGAMREQQHRRVGFQPFPQRRHLVFVVVDFGVEASADSPGQHPDQVDRDATPPG